jgi:membrane protein implicated in regulation of membrane protease activity
MTYDTHALVWVALAILAAIFEVSAPHFGSIFVSVGAVAAAIASVLGYGVTTQVLVFVAMIGLSLGLLRSRLARQLNSRGVPSRTEQLIGREGLVTQAIDPRLGLGRVIVRGEDWAAHAATPLPAGTKIRVLAADGIVLEVAPA